MPESLRASAALAAGCDLVLELPVPYSFGSAEHFARAGVTIAERTGVCDTLLFGSESGELQALMRARDVLDSPELLEAQAELLRLDRTIGEQRARYSAVSKLCGDDLAKLVSSSNNILALEYIKAARTLGATLKLETIKRVGSAYNDTCSSTGCVSAAFLRKRIFRDEDISEYVPRQCMPYVESAKERGMLGARLENAEGAILSHLRLCDPKDAQKCADAHGGLAYRLVDAAHEASTLDELFMLAATKKYTNARIRRAMLSIMLGVMPEDMKREPAYVRVLAANTKGLSLLKDMSERSRIPIVTKLSELAKKELTCERQYVLSRRAQALYTLMLPKPLPSYELFKRSVTIAEK